MGLIDLKHTKTSDCKQFEDHLLAKSTIKYRTLSEIEPKKNKCFICGDKCVSDICHDCAVEFPVKKLTPEQKAECHERAKWTMALKDVG